jgi:carboxypeptidase Taq
LAAVWNEYYEKLLGVIVPDDKNGCLQDVHWSHGSFGYFATYSIGSLYAAQLFSSIKKINPQLNQEIANGNTNLVWSWLQKHIYPAGRFYTSSDLCKNATGEILNPDYFLTYIAGKYAEIYRL